ncbi:cache domain-containing sensor histidine kinase [Paenibacillus hexagrammi]|uniref:Histidine kinase n=1 Tax=Paenibacillus hexagrammi TaxID=2908839 RepID=A0ABY3SIY6_9BACL|nr:histidine kinase [Paenibacillus sp. YPD9-1]UJF33997.1 histidine kinase [Paenibacillus sp. YPD9-1]
MNDLKFSIRNKLIVLLMLSAIVPFGLSILFNYQHTSRMVREQTLQENVKLLSAGQRNIDSYLKRIDQLGLTLYNKAVSNNLFRRNSQGDDDFYQKVKDMLLTILSSNSNIKRVDWKFFESGNTYTLTPALWMRTWQDPGKARLSEPLLRNPYKGYFAMQDGQNLVHQRAFIDIPGSEVLGSLTITIDKQELEDLVHDLFVRGDSEFYLFNPENQPLLQSVPGVDDGLLQDAFVAPEWYVKIQNDSRLSGYLEWEDGGFRGITMFNKLTGTNEGWVMVKRIPYAVLNRNAREIVRINLQIGALALVLAVIATMAVSVRITSPLRTLIRNIRHIKKGHLQVDYDSLGNDEIGVVGDQFKSMVETIRSLMIKEYNLELQNKTQQLNALQAQLNPHFLNNALQSTAALAYENEDYDVYRLIRSLSKMMRYSMNIEEELVPLAREIEHVRAYLELQGHRFEERLQVDLKTDGQCGEWLVPKMTIQPLVENYFKHAFDSKSSKGMLGIRTLRVEDGDEGKLSITVEDDGQGMDEREIVVIMQAVERQRDQKEPYRKVGLVNLIRRIQLYYGDSAEIRLENRHGGGFRVFLLLPRHIPKRDNIMIIGNGGIQA